VLAAGPIAATTEAEDVDGGPLLGCCWQGQSWPPPKLEMSMAGPLEGATGMSGSGHHRSLKLETLMAGPRACWR
jgi:hypothetical protein